LDELFRRRAGRDLALLLPDAVEDFEAAIPV
jgi:hypothetical protein